MEGLAVRPVSTVDWPAIEKLFGEKGACGGCWCMWWRLPRHGKAWEAAKGEPNRAALRRIVESGGQHAMMAFAAGEPVGWCSFGPRAEFPHLERMRAARRAWDARTWAVLCFYIHPRWRGRGVAEQLLAAATARAFELGAREIEAYPVEWKLGRAPAAFAYTGVPAMFEAAGYDLVACPPANGRRVYLKRQG